jgi:hypothetical protein
MELKTIELGASLQDACNNNKIEFLRSSTLFGSVVVVVLPR